MTRLERLVLWLLLGYGFCGCTRTVETRAESTLQATQAVQEKASETTTETVQTGPETITTTVEEWAAAPAAQVSSRNQAAADHPRPGAESAAAPPILVKRTVTVDRRGPILDVKASVETSSLKSQQSIQATTKTATKATTSYWPPAWLLATLAGLLTLGLALLRGWLKMPFGL